MRKRPLNWKSAACIGVIGSLMMACPVYAQTIEADEPMLIAENPEETQEETQEEKQTGTKLKMPELSEGTETENYTDNTSKMTIGSLSFLLPEGWSVLDQQAGSEYGTAVENAVIDTGDELSSLEIHYQEGSLWDSMDDHIEDVAKKMTEDSSVTAAKTTILPTGDINSYDSARLFCTAASEETSWITSCVLIEDVNYGLYEITYTVYDGGSYDLISFEGFIDSVGKAGSDLPEFLADLDMEKYDEYSYTSFSSWSLDWAYSNDTIPEYSDIVVDGIVIPLGCTMQEVLDSGFAVDSYYKDSLSDMVNAGDTESIELIGPNGTEIYVRGKNPGEAAVGLPETIVYSVSNSYSCTDLSSVTFHDFSDGDIMAIREAYGEPNSFSNSEYGDSWTVCWGSYWNVQITLKVENGVIIGIDITDYSITD